MISDLWDQDVTVVVPTRNEASNIDPLLRRLDKVGASAILFVDDSDDDTAQMVTLTTSSCDTKIDVIERRGAARTGGLSGAVLRGLEAVATPWVVVMDGDLQHPPEVIATLVGVAVQTGADIVVATRHNWDSINEGLSLARRALSWCAGRAAFRLLPDALSSVNDPLSGFFLVRVDRLDVTRLHPDGFKILMEIVATHPELRIAETPFHFGHRNSGDSKGTVTEGVRYLRHLWGLRSRVRAQTPR